MAANEEGKLVPAAKALASFAETNGWVRHARHPLFLKKGTDGKTYGLRLVKQSLTVEVKRPTTKAERATVRKAMVWQAISTKGILSLVKKNKVTGLNLPDPVK